MTKEHLIGPYVRKFLLEDIVTDRNLSLNTQKSYRDTIRLLLLFMAESYSTDPGRLTVEQVTVDIARSFLVYLEQERGNSVSTRNQRLTAIHSFFRLISRQIPDLIDHATQIRSILLRRTTGPTIPYLEKEEIDALLDVPDLSRPQGRRDYALLLFLYNTGARANEAADVTVRALNLTSPQSVRIIGKGGKTRYCPLWSHTANVLRNLVATRLDGDRDTNVFLNVRGQPITRFGIYRLVQRTSAKASEKIPSLREKLVGPHIIRHSTAVHLLRSGVDINTIRAWLGHVRLETTNLYAEVDLQMKAKALEICAVTQPIPEEEHSPIWRNDSELLSFLRSL